MRNLKQNTLVAAFILGAGLSTSANASLMQYNGTGGAVPPSGSLGLFSSPIVVGDARTINDVFISLNNFTHTWIGDIFATLAFDDGSNPAVSMVLFGTEGTFMPGNNANGTYTFADGGTPGFVSAGNTIPSGTYAPTGSFSVFDGLNSAGTWTLNLDDQYDADSGSLGSWTLNINSSDNDTATAVPAPATLALLGLGLVGLGWSRRKKS